MKTAYYFLPSIIFVLLLSSAVLPQEKYFIYFKDKGVTPGTTLDKNSASYIEALNNLSGKAVERRKKVMGENIITYEDYPVAEQYTVKLEQSGIKIINKLKWFNAVTAYLTNDEISALNNFSFIKEIIQVRKLKYRGENIEDNTSLNKTAYPPTNYGGSFTQLNLSGIPLVHSKGINGSGIIIGLLDTGFRWRQHESLMNSDVIAEHDFVFNDNITANEEEDRYDQDEHGTGVFSVIGGYEDSILIGAAYGASYILAKTEDVRSETTVEEDNYAAALEWMEGLGVDITSSSLGYNIFDEGESYTYTDMNGRTAVVTKAAEFAFQRGVVTITSAGNEGDNSWKYITAPADGFNVISVGAVNSNNEIASFSSRGPTYDGRIKPEITAMGVGVYQALAGISSGYTRLSGTSFSAPIAAGVAGLLLSAHPYLKNSQVRSIILETAGNTLSQNNEIGWGLINATDAISFPNLEEGDRYILHKYFFNADSVIPSSAKINYIIKDSVITEAMNFTGSEFTSHIPLLNINDKLRFYFTFNGISAAGYREPEELNKTYAVTYGNLDVGLNHTVSQVYDYGILSQNFPNPAVGYTTIKFKAVAGLNAEIIIYNSIGQKVETLFSGLTQQGENTVVWNGRNGAGHTAASGMYIYVLNLSGSYYARKMIFLK